MKTIMTKLVELFTPFAGVVLHARPKADGISRDGWEDYISHKNGVFVESGASIG